MSRADPEPCLIVHGVAVRPAPGETRCGDHWVAEAVGDRTLLAVIDGLGHGEHAESAAHLAAEVIIRNAADDLPAVMAEAHRVLRATRGAAISLIAIGSDRLEWLAVGNVQGVLRHAATGDTTRLVTRPGIVGSRLPRLQPAAATLADGDVVAMFTDGVAEQAARELTARREPDDLAPWLLDRHATGTDDALVLVARRARSRP